MVVQISYERHSDYTCNVGTTLSQLFFATWERTLTLFYLKYVLHTIPEKAGMTYSFDKIYVTDMQV